MSHIFEKLQYHTEPNHSAYAIQSLNKINSKLDENNYWTYAFILQNEKLNDNEKKVYTEMLCKTLESEKKYEIQLLERKLSQHTIEDGDLCGNENNNIKQ